MNNETPKKNELGNIYGSRVSKNGKWLNLLIVTHIHGEEARITCPIRIVEEYDGKNEKPVAQVGVKFASIYDVPVYEDKKPTEAQAAAEDSDIPF